MKCNQKEPITGYRKKQKAQTYNLILDNAKCLFESLGFEKTTMKRIAEETGISPGAIFKHFENKSDLLASALFEDIEAVQKNALNRIPQDETVEKQFLFVTKHFFQYYALRPALSKVLVEHSLFIKGEWEEKFNAHSMRLVDKTDQLIQNAIKQNKIKKNIDSKLLASAFFSHYLFVLILCVKEPIINPDVATGMLAPFINLAISGAIIKHFALTHFKAFHITVKSTFSSVTITTQSSY